VIIYSFVGSMKELDVIDVCKQVNSVLIIINNKYLQIIILKMYPDRGGSRIIFKRGCTIPKKGPHYHVNTKY